MEMVRLELSEGELAEPHVSSGKIDGLAYSWCPTMDLIAFTANNGKNVLFHRKNGYKVWDIPVQEGMVKGLVWKPDGKQFSVITTKNKCFIYESNTARLLTTEDQIKDDVTFGKWITTENADGESHKYSELVNIDVLKALPKLPPLPNSSSMNTFTTKVAIDGLILQNERGNEMDILLLFSEKALHMTFNGLFSIDSINIIAPENDEDEEIVAHISKDVQHHYVITSSFTTMKLHLRHFLVSFDSDYRLVHEMTTISSKIIALLGYINEILIFLAQDIRTFLDFSNRFLGILKEELEKIDTTAADELYDLLLTGMMSDELKDWLENTLAERGINRWSKTGDAVFENTRRTIFYHLIPSCERLIILLSTARGITKASIPEEKKFNQELLDTCTTSVQNLMKIAFQYILKVNREQDLFGAFVNWVHAVLRDLQDEEPRTFYQTSDVTEFIDSHLERSTLMMLIPQMRRHFNEVKINTSDLFGSIKDLIKEMVVSDNEKFELGMVTEKQKLRFNEEFLYIYSHGNAIISIYRFNTLSSKLESIDVEMGGEVLDMQISEVSDEVIVVLGDEVLSFDTERLFEQSQTKFKFSDLNIMKRKSFASLRPKHLAISTQENVGCLISDDMERFLAFRLNSEEPLPEKSAGSGDIELA